MMLSEARRRAADYWYTPAGIMARINMLSESFTYKIVNNALLAYGQSGGITRWRWTTNPGASRTGPCAYCDSQSGRIYRKGQFLPPLPAHANCVCTWELMYDPDEILPTLTPKVTGKGFLVDAPDWRANLDIIAKSVVFLLLFAVADKKQRITKYTQLQKMLIQQGYNRIEVEARTDAELEFWLKRGFTKIRDDRLRKNIG